MDFGAQFARLLDTYRKPDGSRWQLKEIEDATNGFVKGGYLTNLRKGRIRQPGWDRMKAIAYVMGFSMRLWFEEPENWSRIVEGGSGSEEAGKNLRARLNLLFDVVSNERTGEPYTNKEVSDLSFGRLTQDEVARARAGEVEDFKGAQYLALSEIFGVDVSYWYGPPQQRPALDQETLEALQDEKNHLILNKMRGRSDREKDILLHLLDQLDLLRADTVPEPPTNQQASTPAEGPSRRPRRA